MKNIHILPTEKPSRLIFNSFHKSFCHQKEIDGMYINDGKVSGADFWGLQKALNNGFKPQNLYITSDDIAYPYALHFLNQEVLKINGVGGNSGELYHDKGFSYPDQCKKIILTTDQDLIKDGVQAIDDEFLDWFVKNPSCEYVKVIDKMRIFNVDELRERHRKGLPHLYSEKIAYKIIIPKEEPKQETLEKVLGSSKCQFSIMENKLATLYRNQVKIYNTITKQEQMYSEEDMLNYALFILNNNVITVKEWFEKFKK